MNKKELRKAMSEQLVEIKQWAEEGIKQLAPGEQRFIDEYIEISLLIESHHDKFDKLNVKLMKKLEKKI